MKSFFNHFTAATTVIHFGSGFYPQSKALVVDLMRLNPLRDSSVAAIQRNDDGSREKGTKKVRIKSVYAFLF